LQSKSNSVSDENRKDNGINYFDTERFQSLFGNFLKQMNELNNLAAFGPFTSLMGDQKVNLNALKEYGNLLIRFQSNLNLYLSAMINAYFLAINKSAASAKEEMTSEEFRKLTINSFEDVFTTMYESPEYSITYNNLINSIIDLNKSYQKFIDTNPLLVKQNQYQFTKEEKDLLFYNLYEIKKLSLDIKKKLNENQNE
jgi:hypothetical protein